MKNNLKIKIIHCACFVAWLRVPPLKKRNVTSSHLNCSHLRPLQPPPSPPLNAFVYVCSSAADEMETSSCTSTTDTQCQCRSGTFCVPDQACEVCKRCAKYVVPLAGPGPFISLTSCHMGSFFVWISNQFARIASWCLFTFNQSAAVQPTYWKQ